MPLFILEAIRRVLALGFLLSGFWFTLQTGGRMFLVELVDFEHDFGSNPYWMSRDTGLADFIKKRTTGRTQVAGGSDWTRLVNALREEAVEGAAQRLDGGSGPARWVFRVEDFPVSPDLSVSQMSYVSVPSELAWVSLDPVFAQEVRGLDKRWVYPKRWLGLGLVALAFVFYFLVPRGKVPEGALFYGRGAAVVGPDLLGLVGGGFFFALPLLVLSENVPGQQPWSSLGGWSYLTCALWFLAGLFFVLLGVGLFYSTLFVRLSEEALVVQKGFGARSYCWEEMQSCSVYESKRGKVVGLLLVVFANSPRMLGQGLLVAGNVERGLEVRMKGGRILRIMENSFSGYAAVVEALGAHAVPGADEIEN